MSKLDINNINITDRYVNSLYALKDKKFDDLTIHKAKLCILDYIGVTLAGSRFLEGKIEEIVKNFDSINSEIKIYGLDIKCSVENAIFINGLSSHVLELDDGVRFGALHPGAPILSTLLPVAHKYNLSGENLIKGLVIGYEASINLGYSIQPGHYNKGYHPSATCGSIGAAVSIAIANQFNKKKLKAVITNAAISASGTLKVIEDFSEMKPYNIAKASLSALYSYYMANAEFGFPEDVLSGKGGFLNMFGGEYAENRLIRQENDLLKIHKVYFKTFAACRHCHTGIDAALKLREEYPLKVENIDVINIYSYEYVIGKHDHNVVHGTSSAKMSIPYSVAIALLYGDASEEFYSEDYINNIKIKELMKKIEVFSSKELSELVPEKRPSIVEIIMKNGDILSKRIDFPKGEPENPFSDEELIAKFTSLATYARKSKNEIDDIIYNVMNIESEFNKLAGLI